jgi:hypothetical protein
VDYAERHPTPATVISTVWELEPADVSKVEKVLGSACLKSTELRVWKTYDSSTQTWSTSLDEQQIVVNLIDAEELYAEQN